MCFYTCFVLQEYRTGFKISFHNSKTFFNFPTSMIYFYDWWGIIFQVCAYSIKTIEFFFGCNLFFIEWSKSFWGNFSIICTMLLNNKPFRIICFFLVQFRRPVNQLFCPFQLTLTNRMLIFFVFKGERNNEMLFKTIFIYPYADIFLMPKFCKNHIIARIYWKNIGINSLSWIIHHYVVKVAESHAVTVF